MNAKDKDHENKTEAGRWGWIRREARKQELIARRRKGLWYFADYNNYLRSPEQGMDDFEAELYLMDGVLERCRPVTKGLERPATNP